MNAINPLGFDRDTGNKKLDAVLVKLEEYDFSPITNSCVNRYGWSEEKAGKIEIEVKRFFSFAFLDTGNYHIPESDVDEYWHRMILHTQWCQEFCQNIFGSYYHHTPEPDQNFISQENRERSMRLGPVDIHFNQRQIAATSTKDKYDEANLS